MDNVLSDIFLRMMLLFIEEKLDVIIWGIKKIELYFFVNNIYVVECNLIIKNIFLLFY